MVPIKVMVPSTRLALASKLNDAHDQIYDVETSRKERKPRKISNSPIKSKLAKFVIRR